MKRSKSKIAPVGAGWIDNLTEQSVRFELLIDEISNVPEDWTQIQVYAKNGGDWLGGVTLDCVDGRVALSAEENANRLNFVVSIDCPAHDGNQGCFSHVRLDRFPDRRRWWCLFCFRRSKSAFVSGRSRRWQLFVERQRNNRLT